LINALDDPDPEVRWSVVDALESLGDQRAIEPLQKLKNDMDEDVRDAVKDALSAIITTR